MLICIIQLRFSEDVHTAIPMFSTIERRDKRTMRDDDGVFDDAAIHEEMR